MIKNKKNIIFFICLGLMLVPVFSVFAADSAGVTGSLLSWTGGRLIDLISLVTGFVCMIIVWVMSVLLKITGNIFDSLIGGTTLFSDYYNNVVSSGWVIVRDILNIVFVLALLGIAFATILKIESYHFKALLPKLLVAALLVNFSKTVCLTMIDFSNAIMQGIMGTQNGLTSSAGILAMMNMDSFASLDDNMSAITTNISVSGSYVLLVVFLGMFLMAICGLCVLLIIRIVVLMILTVFSPIAFVLNVLPVTQKYASKWWEEFVKYLFVGPVVCICFLLALFFVAQASSTGFSALINEKDNLGALAANTGQFYGLAIACGIMMVGFTFTKEVASGMAEAVMGLVKKGLLGAGIMAGQFGLRKAATMKEWKTIQGLNKRFFKPWGQALQGKIDAAGAGGAKGERALLGLGKGVGGLLSGVAWSARRGIGFGMGWKARSARLWSETMEPVAGEAHDTLNYVLGLGEKTHFGRRARKNLEQKKMQEMSAKSSSEQRELYMGASSNIEKGAILRQIVASMNGNDLMNEPKFFDRNREVMIQASRREGIFANDEARIRYETDVEGRFAGGATRVDAEIAAKAAIPEVDLAVTKTSAPIFDPTLFKEVLYNELGGDTDEAGELIADLSEISGDAGLIPTYGMATREKGRWRKTTSREQQAVVEDKRRKQAGRAFINRAHSNAYFRETTSGQLAEVSESGWDLVMHDDWDLVSKFAEQGRGDVKDGYMAVVNDPTTGGKVANHTLIKRRARIANTGQVGSDRAKIEDELTELRGLGHPDAEQSKRIDYLDKEERSMQNRAQMAYAKALWLELAQAKTTTDETGADISGAIRAAAGVAAGADFKFDHIKHYVETII